ncbi:hypothetical protein ACQWHJ_25245, partial [Salmonella enterica subsp. enterica serovar Infantis]
CFFNGYRASFFVGVYIFYLLLAILFYLGGGCFLFGQGFFFNRARLQIFVMQAFVFKFAQPGIEGY